jgi:hypothetical protein
MEWRLFDVIKSKIKELTNRMILLGLYRFLMADLICE